MFQIGKVFSGFNSHLLLTKSLKDRNYHPHFVGIYYISHIRYIHSTWYIYFI